MSKRTLLIVAGIFLCVLLAVVACIHLFSPTTIIQPELTLEADEDSILKDWLDTPTIGPHEISDIALTKDGFLMATGTGVSRWRYKDGMPCFAEPILLDDGSELVPCRQLQIDEKGGVWICGVHGIGYLAKGKNFPKWFAFKGEIHDMVLSSDGKRLWIVGPGGIATVDTKYYQWQVFKKKDLVDIAVHPAKDIVWCRQISHPRGMGHLKCTTFQFDLANGQWIDVHNSKSRWPFGMRFAVYQKLNNWAWFYRGGDPPVAIDLETNKISSQGRLPGWELIEKNVMHYTDFSGQIIPANDDTADIWYASRIGVCRYMVESHCWKSYKYLNEPISGKTKLIWSHDGQTLYWSCNGIVASFDTNIYSWKPLWTIESEPYPPRDADDPLLLSPDGKTLWQTGSWGVAVGDPEQHSVSLLNDDVVLGLSEAKFVRFDEIRKCALVVTPRGVVITDYQGTPKATLTNPSPRVQHKIVDFRFSPDGNEVWCLAEDSSGSSIAAHVYFPKTRQWEKIPEAKSKGRFFDVVFSKDGSTVCLSRQRSGESKPLILQRQSETRTWKPLAAKMPGFFHHVEKFYLSPDGKELWITSWGDGVLSTNLANGKVTHYRETHYHHNEDITEKPLVGDYVKDLAFVHKGTMVVCAAGGGGEEGLALIDLKTNSVTNLPLGKISQIEELHVESDDRTIKCIFNAARPRKFDTKERKWLGDGPVGVRECMFGHAFHAPEPLAIEGNCVLKSTQNGIAKVNSNGKEVDIFSPAPGETGFEAPHVLPIPGSKEYLCSFSRNGETGIYRLNITSRELRLLLKYPGDATCLKIAPDGRAWAGLPGRIVCLDIVSGEEIPLWPEGETRLPTVAAVKRPPDSAFGGLTIAPRKVEEIHILPPSDSREIDKAERDYLAIIDSGNKLALLYEADLYPGHPDRNCPHIRNWLGDRWSKSKKIPFKTQGFDNPIAAQHGNQTLVSWNYVLPGDGNRKIRGYSILGKGGTWTTPAALCQNKKGESLNNAFVGLHVDQQGQVYTAWNSGVDNAETFFAKVTQLGKK